MTVNFIPPYCAQGDLNIFSCDKIPSQTTKKIPNEHSRFVLAHSETGHHHVISANSVSVFEENEFVSYLDVKASSDIQHLRSFDRHETIKLPIGKYRVTRQREYVPNGFRVAQD